MASVRLTNFDRDEIRNKALKAAFNGREVALDKRENAVAKEAYEAVIPADERAKVAKLPENWVRFDSCLNFNVAGASIRLQTGGKGFPVPYQPKGSSKGGYSCHGRLGSIPAGDLADRIMAVMADRQTFREDYGKACNALRGMLASINTTGKLGETWPEGKEFFAHLEKAREGASVPSVRVEEINNLLGIKSAA